MIAFIEYPHWLKPEIIPGFPLFRWYGLMYFVAFAVTYVLFKYQVKERALPISQDNIVNWFYWTILGMLLGARIFGTVVYDPTGIYLRQPWLIFWPFREGRFVGFQGMSYHGGLIGAMIGSYLYCRRGRLNFLQICDIASAGIPLGYTFGRLGNFINGELWGRISTAPWAMMFPHAPRFPVKVDWVLETARKAGIEITPATRYVNLPRHPSQLYEAFFEGIVLWLFLWFVVRKRKRFNGQVFSTYIMGYGFVRFFIEYFREPDEGIGFPISFTGGDSPLYLTASPWDFSTGQILCFLMILGGAALYLIMRHRSRRRGLQENGDE